METEANPSCFQSLPRELVLVVAEQLDDAVTLANLCVSSKDLYLFSQPLLFRHLDFTTTRSIQAFVRALALRPSLAHLVKGITLRTSISHDLHPDDGIRYILKDIMDQCTNLVCLIIEWLPLYASYTFWDTIHVTNILCLDIGNNDGLTIPQILEKFSSLKRLRIRGYRWKSGLDEWSEATVGPRPVSKTPSPFSPNLRCLELFDIVLALDDLMWFFQRCPNLCDLRVFISHHQHQHRKQDPQRVADTFKSAPSLRRLAILYLRSEDRLFRPKGFLLSAVQSVPQIKYLHTDDAFCDWEFLKVCGPGLEWFEIELGSPGGSLPRSRAFMMLLSSMVKPQKIWPKLRVLYVQSLGQLWSKGTETGLETLDNLSNRAGISVVWKGCELLGACKNKSN